MQHTKLIGPVASYIAAANAQDIEAATANFSEGAVVRDERRNRQGIAAIRQWAMEASEKHRLTFEMLDVAQAEGRTVLTGRVHGNFPGRARSSGVMTLLWMAERSSAWRSRDGSAPRFSFDPTEFSGKRVLVTGGT